MQAQTPRLAAGAVSAEASSVTALEAPVAPLPPPASDERDTSKGYLRRYPPQPKLLEAGVFLGPLFISDLNSFGTAPIRNADGPPTIKPLSTFDRPALEIGLRGGYFPLTFLGGELEAIFVSTESDIGTDVKVFGVRTQAVVQLPRWSIVPFAVGGIGFWRVLNRVSGNDTDPAFHYGVGAKATLTRHIAVRVDLRDSITNKLNNRSYPHNIEALAGASFVFGRSERVVLDSDKDTVIDDEDQCPFEPGIPPSGCPVRDSDGDGIPDTDDQCVMEAGVAPTGCPPRDTDQDGIFDEQDECVEVKGVAPTGCPDSDGDGFLDRDDHCVQVPGVAPDGCPADPDGDGLVGADDHCPDQPETKNGFEDADGCPDELPTAVASFVGVMVGIEFDRDRADIRPTSEDVLAHAASILRDYPSLRVEIVGHTDSRGSREHNLELSLNRALAVKENLVLRGIEASRIESTGAGPDEPLTTNDTPAGRQKNRRIEFHVIE